MAVCQKTKSFPKESTFTSRTFHVLGCDTPHQFKDENILQCGKSYEWKSCSNLHIWMCKDCTIGIPSGSTLQRSPARTTSISSRKVSNMASSVCKELISIAENEKVYFKLCSHNATESATFQCGTKVNCVEHFGCNQDHTILCLGCMKVVPRETLCTKIIKCKPGEAYLVLPCGQAHIIVDDEQEESQSFNCGQSFTLTDLDTCTIKAHKIYCNKCQVKHVTGSVGLERSFGNKPAATSTPIRTDFNNPDSTKKTPDINGTILDLHKDVKTAINDKDNKPCINSKHEFDHLSKTLLAAPAKKFLKAVNMLMIQFKKDEVNVIPKELGDELLQEVFDSFEKMAEARRKCMEVLSETDILENPKYEEYMKTKRAMMYDCQRIHSEYYSNLKKENIFKKATFSHHQTPPHKMMELNRFKNNERLFENPHMPSFMNQQSFVKSTNPELNLRTDKFFKLKDELALIEKFDASQPRSYMAFRAQWANFISKMNQSQRSELDKYYALLSKLDGKAKSFIQTKYPRDDTYATAISKLDTLFYQPANLIRDMINSLMKTNKMYDNYDSLLSGMTSLWSAWADLDHAELTNDQLKGLFFISATEKNLSEGSWKCWLDVQNSTSNEDPMACFDINSFMGAINQAMTNQQRKQNAIGYRTSSNFPTNNKPKSTLYGSYNTQSRKPTEQQQALKDGCCVFCNGKPHKYQLQCWALSHKNPHKIRKIMDQFKITCTLCLSKGHLSWDCPSYKAGYLKRCAKCNELHTIYLHMPYNQVQKNVSFSKDPKVKE